MPVFLILSFVTVSICQDHQIKNDKYKFTLNCPHGLTIYEDKNTILEYRGTEKNHDRDSLFFLKSIMLVKDSFINQLESYMNQPSTVEGMNNDFIGSMAKSFPSISSVDSGFIYFNERPTIQGVYTFSQVNKTPMKGRFMLVLIKEQSAIYVFSRTAKKNQYENWNKTSEDTIKSLRIIPQNDH